jgi:2-polyprenyl-3-methyl-5-hydroxy-6-metoxy-1,4-benzoquinol methylase
MVDSARSRGVSYDPHNVCTAGGTSGAEIKELIIRLAKKYAGNDGVHSIIDVGAGKGSLLRILQREYPHASLAAIDYLAAPNDLHNIEWIEADLNRPPPLNRKFELVICSEVIEHVENPRNLLRYLKELISEGGHLIVTTPNQMSVRSVLSLLLYGHFVAFRDECYPAHISALLKKDMERMISESGLVHGGFYYTNQGSLPKLPRATWQSVSFGLARGAAFSDNIAFVASKPLRGQIAR